MLEQINLDDKTYEQLLKEALEQLSASSGESGNWTDYNAHDPGITFLELFAWLTEMQRFHLNQITDKHKLKYLALLGTAPKPAEPMRLPVIFEPADDEGFCLNGRLCLEGGLTIIEKGITALVEGIPYTVTEDVYIRDFDIDFEQKEGCVSLRFTNTLYEGERLRLFVKLADIGRVPMQEGYYTFAKLHIEDCDYIDETYGLMQSGVITATPRRDCNALRITVINNRDFDVFPVIEWLSPRYTELIQIDNDGETLGGNGAIKENTAFYLNYDIQAYNPLPSYGGYDAETIEQAFERINNQSTETYRAVTFSDYKTLVAETPGTIIESVNVYSPEPGKVCVCIKPFNEIYKKNIYRYLFDRKLPCIEIEIIKPIFWESNLYATVTPHDWAIDKSAEINMFISDYVKKSKGIFGYVISLYQWTEDFCKQCPYIKEVNSLSLVRVNGETVFPGEETTLPPNGLLRIINAEINITF